ncbi:hypothetical protein AKJ52_02295 [candidate division MSBL1 archaeon SCGC-AAA382C18]|uniref:Uncharacterized protein n=1 Tax=candidate division MSBL1 archaeon SCGC-AAA382C18 TaxID=1698281 RepID=A0A133VIV5_9EURY|nr:hypothetical protein AKJ52_02295 [candidate division MSBL1 archaeon SCGC-AAA382C18]
MAIVFDAIFSTDEILFSLYTTFRQIHDESVPMPKKNADNDEWYSVAERLPKQVRIQILKVLLDDFYQKSIAEFCGVVPSAISHWVNREEYWPSARSSVHLLRLGAKLKPEKTKGIILEDVEEHLTKLREAGIPIQKVLKKMKT